MSSAIFEVATRQSVNGSLIAVRLRILASPMHELMQAVQVDADK